MVSEVKDGHVCLSVHDTGIGIPADSLGTIFDDYVQLQNPARERQKGLGLGLSIARRIAHLLGHRLTVQSTVGRGSTFTIELPEGRPLGTPAVEPFTQPKMTGAGHPAVMLIDDDPDVGDATKLALETFDYTVHVSACGDDALAHIAGGYTPDIVISDFRLPDYDGIEVIRRIRSVMKRDVPAILATGDIFIRDESLPKDCSLVRKPIDIDELAAITSQLLAGAA